MESHDLTKSEEQEFYIPIDSYIENFKTHLRSHPRTIFSAKFGDGKSYFLNKIQEDETFKYYTFLTIHPINYQVESNKDIFELVKRDILLQMLANKMIAEDYEIPDSVAIQFFVQNNAGTVAEFFISSLANINADSKLYTDITSGYAAFGFVRKLKAKYKEFKNRCSNEEYIEQFFTKTDNIPSVEYDAISKIISSNIKTYQEKNHKKVVLIFEDMDRIDPAHLFRIMNVLSAQMDLPYIAKDNPDDTLNKYGFDNIVLVLDYDNLEKIYHHFYGPDTDFSGYISKFSPRGYFHYSLKEIRREYVYKELKRLTELPCRILEKIITNEDIDNLDLRKIVESIKDVDSQILYNASVDVDGKSIISSYRILQMTIIMLRLGKTKYEILSKYDSFLKENVMNIAFFNSYFLKYDLMFKKESLLNVYDRREYIRIDEGKYYKLNYRGIYKGEDGLALIEPDILNTCGYNNCTTYRDIAESVFYFISQ